VRRAFFHGVVLLLALAAWVTAEIAPALAETGPGPGSALVVSSDGASWSTDLASPLFDPAVLWVPGDSRTSTFYVQNRGATPASLRMQVRTAGGDLVAAGDVQVSARVGDDAWHRVRAAGDGVLNALAIGTDQSRRVDVRAVFRRGSRNASQSAGVVLRFVVDLGQAVAGPSGPDSLPATGAPRLGLPVLLGCLLVGSGTALVRRRRSG
jgi:hypothetical protein